MMYKSIKGTVPDFSLRIFHQWLLLLLTTCFILACTTVFCEDIDLNELDVDVPLVLTELDLDPQSVLVMTRISFRRVLKLGNFCILLSPHICALQLCQGELSSANHVLCFYPCVFEEVISGCSCVLLWLSLPLENLFMMQVLPSCMCSWIFFYH